MTSLTTTYVFGGGVAVDEHLRVDVSRDDDVDLGEAYLRRGSDGELCAPRGDGRHLLDDVVTWQRRLERYACGGDDT